MSEFREEFTSWVVCMIDVSLVLALHREGSLAQHTLLSLREAARHARAEGITIELVATLDRADDLTRRVLHDFGTDGFNGVTVLEVDHGSLGPSRNSGIKAARGEYIYTCDGDDLVSFNCFKVMFRLSQAVGPECLIFHQYLYAFGRNSHYWKFFPLETVTPLVFLDRHPYTSAAFAHRSVFESVPYTDTRISSGYAFEDWHFNAECVVRGRRIVVAEDTMLFYRQREDSLRDQANIQTTRQPPPCTLFEPETWVRVTRDAYQRFARFGGALPYAPALDEWRTVLDNAPLRDFICAANAIDPSVDTSILKDAPIGGNLNRSDLTAGLAYHEICCIIGTRCFDEVFMLRRAGDVVSALLGASPTARILVILGSPVAVGSHVAPLPSNVTVLNLANDWPRLTAEQRQLISLKIIESTAPEANLYLRPTLFCEGFYRRFKLILSNPIRWLPVDMFDVSVVLAVHHEGMILRHTLVSLREAARYARAEGITIELVAVLDRADELTRRVLQEFGKDGFDGLTVLEVDYGSPGPTRNSGVDAAQGQYIYTSDGDDLISLNSFAAMFRMAEAVGPNNIIFHGYECQFGERYGNVKYFPLDTVTPLAFLERQPYTSSAFAHRSVFEAVRYVPDSAGYAHEDWHFNAECVAHGYQIRVTNDTIRFYRVRRGSRLDQLTRHSTNQIAPCTLFEPETWMHITREVYERLAPLGGVLSHALEEDDGWACVLDSAPLRDFIRAANAIEPKIDPSIVKSAPLYSNLGAPELAVGLAYYEICRIIGARRYDDVFLVRHAGDVLEALHDTPATARVLVIQISSPAAGSRVAPAPSNVTIWNFADNWPRLAVNQRQLIVLKIIESTAQRARLHLQRSAFCEEFYGRFKTILFNPVRWLPLDVFDVSLVLALHREGALLQRTLLSLREAARYARTAGMSIELVATLDRADEVTRKVLQEFGSEGFDGWTVMEVDHGSLGPSRNSGIKVARGEYIYTCDGDDLVSINSFAAMFQVAQATGPECVIFHQYLCAFGYNPHCWKYFPLDAISPLAFLEYHPYTSAAFAHRSIFMSVSYTDSCISSGYAYEDWHFNAECIARGYRIIVAEDTIRFYRQRRGSLLDQANSQTARQIMPCTLFEPQTWTRVTRDAYERFAPFGGVRHDAPDGFGWGGVLDSPPFLDFIRAANAIDPGIDRWILKSSPCESNLCEAEVAAGLAYYEICRIIGAQRFDEVFLMPFIAQGGAELYIGHVLQALYEMRPTARILVLLGEPLASGSYIDRVPPNATVIDLAGDWPQLSLEQREHIALKLIQSTAHCARLHIRQAAFSESFYRRFRTILRSNPTVFYRFGDNMEVDPAGIFARPWGFEFIAEHVHDLALIVADNQTIIERDRNRLAVCAEKWRWLPARHAPLVTAADAVVRAVTAKGRVLWASRLDRQKRPELLLHIARKLESLGSDTRIDVFGSAVLDAFNPDCFAGLRSLSYEGAYDGFATLSHDAYDAFVYTTAWDGMPNVVLEAVAAGLPVIAPDIAGIGEIIVDGESGLLLPSLANDDEMAAAYAAAIVRLAKDPLLRARLVTGALKRLVERHGSAAFAKAVRAIFGGREGAEIGPASGRRGPTALRAGQNGNGCAPVARNG